MRRFESSEFTTVSAMMKDRDVEIPKVAGKEVCLVWALKGKCSASCKRSAQHKSYPRATTTAIHELMDACGVAAGN
jgi:hypothetical protein